MGYGLVLDEGSVFVEKEVTEGTYVAESAGASAIEPLSDGLEFTPTKELLERNNRTSTVEKVPSRVGQKSMAGTIPVELKAAATEGGSPETAPLYEALLGGKRTITETTSATGHTASRIQLTNGDGAKYKVGDIVKVKVYDEDSTKADHVSPVTAVSETLDDNYIDLLIPYGEAFPDSVVIGASTVFFHQSGAPTLSITNYLGGKIREKAIGMRAVSGELTNFSTGQLPQFSFSLEGLSYERSVGEPLFSPVYDQSLPPVVLCAKIYQGSSEIEVNEFSMNIANTLGFLTSTSSCSGKIASRITEMVTTFSCNPYMENDDVDQFNKFDKNQAYSLFGSANNKGTGLNGDNEKLNVVAFYMPNCRTTEISSGDADGILTDAISGQAYRSSGNDSVFIAFI